VQDRKLIGIGAAGAIVAALCCGTPLLVLALGALGLSAWLAWADYVLMPSLLVFLGLLAYGLYLHRHRQPTTYKR
jgi:mercuric ion transport protein